MPRKAPSQVIEHRVSLGTWERQRLETTLLVAAVPLVATAGAVGLASYAFWRLAKFWAGITEPLKDLALDVVTGPIDPDVAKTSWSIWKAFFKGLS